MSLPLKEPKTAKAVEKWIEEHNRSSDEYRLRILDSDRWLTAYLPDGNALSIRR